MKNKQSYFDYSTLNLSTYESNHGPVYSVYVDIDKEIMRCNLKLYKIDFATGIFLYLPNVVFLPINRVDVYSETGL